MIGTLTTLIEYFFIAVQAVGLPALFVVFVLKGALVGKVLPTSVFLPGYVVAVGATYSEAITIVTLVTVAHIIGQLALYVGIRRYGRSILASLPFVDIDRQSKRSRKLNRWFETYGGVAIFTTNVLPWSRGLIAIPVAASAYPTGRYMAHITTATVIYHSAYVGGALTGVAILT